MATQSTPEVPQLGELLRYWRQERGKSQLALSMDTGILQCFTVRSVTLQRSGTSEKHRYSCSAEWPGPAGGGDLRHRDRERCCNQ